MRNAMIPLARLLDTIQRRFQRSRAGSVMILVVTLLVLMAIIGTAFLTTARNDRYSSQLHESNVQVDMLLEGVKNIILGRMAGENFLDPNGQRWDDVHSDNWLASRTPSMMIDACGVWNPGRTYGRGEWVSVVTSTSPLAATFWVSQTDNNTGNIPGPGGPWLQDTTATPTTPCWEAVSSLFDLTQGLGVTAEDVRGVVGGNPAVFDGVRGRNLVRLVSVPINGQYYPAFYFYRPGDPAATPPVQGGFQTVVAASVSGNGIPDSFLWRLPMGQLNGVTYYAAVRVVDNNAAINLNTAGSSLYDFDAQGNPMPNMSFFPGDVGLAELLSTFNLNATNLPTFGQEFGNLNQYRDGAASVPDGIIGSLNPNNFAGPTTPIPDYQGSNGSDFRYLSLADAQFMGLGRRIDYPARSTQSGAQFHNLSWSDSAALAFDFDLVSPTTVQYMTSGTGSASTVETLLPQSLTGYPNNYYSSRPWDPTNAAYANNWFTQNYLYQNPPVTGLISNNFNRRPLVVARNPQSNMMPVHVQEMDLLGSWAPSFTKAMGYNYDPADPTRGNLPRVSLNTAYTLVDAPQSFVTEPQNPIYGSLTPTLWLGFYNAMVGALEYPYSGRINEQQYYLAQTSNTGQIFQDSTGLVPLAQQFRSSLRDSVGLGPFPPVRTGTEAPATTYLPPSSELILRSLIAAVNAKDIRDSDDDVTSATVYGLPVVVGGTYLGPSAGVRLTVYGIERQPFITEVFVNNDTSPQPANFTDPTGNQVPNNTTVGKVNQNGYVAIELYNPYDVPISMAGWTVASMRHSPATPSGPVPKTFYYPTMGPQQIGTLQTFPATIPNIPPRGFLVLENVNPSANSNEYRPWWAYPNTWVKNTQTLADQDRTNTTLYYYVQGLEQVLKDPTNTDSTGNELYLLRPRSATPGVTYPPTQYYDESPVTHPYDNTGTRANSYLEDMAPVDSFDFFGISKSDGATFQAWHYVRANSIYTDTTAVPPINPPRPSWKFVYRGQWDPAVRAVTVTAPGCREEGVFASAAWSTNPALKLPPSDQWDFTPPGPAVVGQYTDSPSTAQINIGLPDYASSYSNPYPGIPLNNSGYGDLGSASPPPNPSPFEHGLNKNLANNSTQTKFNAYPFGGFARTGDVLQAPFIGSYTITYNTGGDTFVIEMNPVTADAGFADDNFVANLPFSRSAFAISEDNDEQLGHLTPLSSADSFQTPISVQSATPPPVNFLPPGVIPTAGVTGLPDTYGWASRVLDYFSANQVPNNDYLPLTKPDLYNMYTATPPAATGYANLIAWPTPQPVANSPAGAPAPNVNASELAAPVEGLININTAPWRVLAQLPFCSLTATAPSANTTMLNNNLLIAQAIVRYRNAYGPFHSLFDLNRVYDSMFFSVSANSGSYNPVTSLSFQAANGAPDTTDYYSFQGVLTPNLPGFVNDGGTSMQKTPSDSVYLPDGLLTDFNQREAEVMKLSNLLTTRSDSFTVYVQVQGWRGAGTPTAQLVVQRRAAFIMDRSGSSRSVDNRSQTTNVISVNIPTKVQTQ